MTCKTSLGESLEHPFTPNPLKKLHYLRAELAANKQTSMGPSPPSPLLPSPPPPPVPPFSFGLPRASFLLFLKFSESEDAQDHSELLLCLGSNESGIETLKLLKSFYLSYLQSCFHFYKLY